MEAYRQIVVPTNNQINITIPDKFIGKRIRDLISAVEEDLSPEQRKIKRDFYVVNAKVDGDKFDRDDANER